MPETVPNLRDIGGLPAASGQSLVPGVVLRSAAPLATDRALGGIVWPPSSVIDLRSEAESIDAHPLDGNGSRVHNIPLLAELAPGAEPHATLRELYLHVVQTVPDRLAQIVDVVVEADGPTLIHCAAGKDRTGVGVALLLRLAGVDREHVMTDYLRTADHYDEIRRRLAIRTGRAFDKPLPRSFLDVSPEAMIAVLDIWDSHSFGVEGWARDAGVEEDRMRQLRERLLGVAV